MIPVTTAEVQVWFLVHVGVLLVAAGWMTVSSLFLPGITGRAAVRLGRTPWTVFLAGLVVALCAAVVITGLSIIPNPVTRFLALVFTVATVILALAGSGGIVRTFAQGMVAAGERPQPTLLRRYGIALVITLTWMLPIAGWFFALPLTLMLGLGCFVFGCFPIKPPRMATTP